MRALVAGWFSYDNSDYTAGDVLACRLVCGWLEEAGCPFDVAWAPSLRRGVNVGTVAPGAYTHAVFVCGPFMQNDWEAQFLGRFADCVVVGVNLTLPVPLDAWNPFDLLLERDSSADAHPDVTFLSPRVSVPVVGVCLVEDYDGADVAAANAAVGRLLASREAAIVRIDTRLDVNAAGLRTPAEVEALLARMDAVVTTRLHGMALALKNGVPVVAIDPEPGGAKIARQAGVLGWPAVFTVDRLDDGTLQEALDYCLSGAARATARACRRRAVEDLQDLRDSFIRALRESSPPGPRRAARLAFAESRRSRT
jgi:hypothetical protein